MNLCVMIGRLTKDVELRYTPAGKAVARMRLAVDNGKGQDPLYIDVVAWDKRAETCSQYLSKGRQVAIQGRLQIRQYGAQDGTKRQATEIVAYDVKFLGGRDQEAGGDQGWAPVGNEISFGDDEIPF